MNFIENQFGGRLRLRVSGLWRWKNSLLLLEIQRGANDTFWTPPGGEVQYGETVKDALKREFYEETHTHIQIQKFLFVNEFIALPLHGVELFFEVCGKDKNAPEHIQCGSDPELAPDKQIITKAQWFDFRKIETMPSRQLHNVLQNRKIASLFSERSQLF